MRRSILGSTVLLGLLTVLLVISVSGWAQKGKPQPPSPPDPAIAYVSRGNGLVVMNADGSNLRTVINERGIHPVQPDWSPDGRQLVFEEVASGLYVINVDGTGLTMIPNTGSDFMMDPAWAPLPFGSDRLEIAYRSANDHLSGESQRNANRELQQYARRR